MPVETSLATGVEVTIPSQRQIRQYPIPHHAPRTSQPPARLFAPVGKIHRYSKVEIHTPGLGILCIKLVASGRRPATKSQAVAPKEIPFRPPPPLEPQRQGARLGRTGPHATARPGTNQYPLQHRLAAATDGRCRTLGAWLCLGCIWPYLLPVHSRPANAHTNPCGLGIPAYYLGTKKTQCGFHRAESDGTYGRCSVRLTTENQQGEVDQPIHTQRLLQTDALGSRRKSTNKHSAHVCLETGPLCIFTYRPKRSHAHLPTCPPTSLPTSMSIRRQPTSPPSSA